jgi:ribosome-binding factor A
MLTRQELSDLGEALRSMRFMMATAVVALDLSNDHKKARAYMAKLSELQDRITEELKNEHLI